jgi:hypothetical protein
MSELTSSFTSGDVTVIGPECFTDGEVICWRGVNYVEQDQVQRLLETETQQ